MADVMIEHGAWGAIYRARTIVQITYDGLLEPLPIVHRGAGFFISKLRVGVWAEWVGGICIGGHLLASLRPCPRLCDFSEAPTNALLPHIGIDVPRFEIADIAGCATNGVRLDAHFS